jgi:molybdate transport repressor ModE-like protein
MNFTLRQVRYFVAVAESGSISGAARQLFVSQSAVTEAVKELEGDLGAPLLERSGRGVSLTHRGQVFLRHANRILLVRPRQRPVTNVVAVFVIAITFLPILGAYYLTQGKDAVAGQRK